MTLDEYAAIDDPRGFLYALSGITDWRMKLRKNLFVKRGARSDLTQRSLRDGRFDMHEGCFSRRWVGKEKQGLLFAGPNVFLLLPEEHIPHPPDRATCYWLSVVRYTQPVVDAWIESLPYKSFRDYPWAATDGIEVLARIPDTYVVDSSWDAWFKTAVRKLKI